MSRVSGPAKNIERRWQASIDDHVIGLDWSPDGKRLAAAGIEGPIAIFDTSKGSRLQTLPGHGFGTTDLAWHPKNNRLIASAGQDRSARLWSNVGDNDMFMSLDGGSAWVERIAWSDDGLYLASAAGKILRVWDAEGKRHGDYPAHPNTIADIAWQPGLTRFATATYNHVQIWRPEVNEADKCFTWKGSSLKLAWSPNSKYLVTGDQDATVHFWIAATGEDLQMSGYRTKVRELSWDSTSRFLATGGSEMPCIWDCSGAGPEDSQPLLLKGHKALLTALAFQRLGTLLVSADADGEIRLWHPASAKKALAVRRADAAVTKLCWSPDDRYLAVASETGQVSVLALI